MHSVERVLAARSQTWKPVFQITSALLYITCKSEINQLIMESHALGHGHPSPHGFWRGVDGAMHTVVSPRTWEYSCRVFVLQHRGHPRDTPWWGVAGRARACAISWDRASLACQIMWTPGGPVRNAPGPAGSHRGAGVASARTETQLLCRLKKSVRKQG